MHDDFWAGVDEITIPWEDLYDDGLLIDYSKMAKEHRLPMRIFFTRALYERYVTPPEGTGWFQDIEGRAWDVLTMFYVGQGYTRLALQREGFMHFECYFVMGRTRSGKPIHRKIILKATVPPSKNDEPVVIVGLPEE